MGTSTPSSREKQTNTSTVPERVPIVLGLILVCLGLLLVADIWLALEDLPLSGQTLVILSVALAVLAIGILLWWLNQLRQEALASSRDLLDAKADLEAILDSQTEAVVRYAPDGTISFVNRAWCQVYGGEPEGWVGRNAFEMVPAGARDQVIAFAGSLTPDQPVGVIDVDVIDAQGRPRRRRLIMQGIFDSAGIRREIQGTGLDITEEWQREQELARYRDELEQLVEERTTELRRQTQIAVSLQHIAYSLGTSLDLEAVLETIVKEISRVRPQDAEVRVMFAAERQLVTAAAVGITTEAQAGFNPSLDTRQCPPVDAYLSRETVILNDLRANGSTPNNPHPPQWRSAIAIPLQSGDDTLGVLYIASEQANAYPPEDIGLLQSFAAHAGLALANARRFGSSASLATVAERQRLSRELHDSVTQTLFSASLHAEVLPLQIQTDTTTALATAERLGVLNRGALGEMRSLLLEMRPEMLVSSDLRTLMGYLCNATQTRARLSATLSLSGDPVVVPPEVHVAFYRVAQEAMNNVVKHAAATAVQVSLDYGETSLALVVADDGRGFNVAADPTGTLGLNSMHERATQIGAELEVTSSPTTGSRVWLCWPYDAATAAARLPR